MACAFYHFNLGFRLKWQKFKLVQHKLTLYFQFLLYSFCLHCHCFHFKNQSGSVNILPRTFSAVYYPQDAICFKFEGNKAF